MTRIEHLRRRCTDGPAHRRGSCASCGSPHGGDGLCLNDHCPSNMPRRAAQDLGASIGTGIGWMTNFGCLALVLGTVVGGLYGLYLLLYGLQLLVQ